MIGDPRPRSPKKLLEGKRGWFFFPCRSVSSLLTPGKSAALLGHRLGPREVAKWSIEDLDVAPDYTAALAVEAPKST